MIRWLKGLLPRHTRSEVEALQQENARLRQRIHFLTAPIEELVRLDTHEVPE